MTVAGSGFPSHSQLCSRAASLPGAERAPSPSCSHLPGQTREPSLHGHDQPAPRAGPNEPTPSATTGEAGSAGVPGLELEGLARVSGGLEPERGAEAVCVRSPLRHLCLGILNPPFQVPLLFPQISTFSFLKFLNNLQRGVACNSNCQKKKKKKEKKSWAEKGICWLV